MILMMFIEKLKNLKIKLDKINKTTMNTTKNLDKIFNKLPVQLNSVSVKLSIMDDIEEFLGQGFGLEEFVEDAISEAKNAAMKASDIVRFDMNDAISQADGSIEEAEAKLKELGADSPQLEGFKKQLSDLESLQKELERQIDNI